MASKLKDATVQICSFADEEIREMNNFVIAVIALKASTVFRYRMPLRRAHGREVARRRG